MEEKEFKWIESIQKLPDEKIILYIQYISKALERTMRDTVESLLREKLAGLELEAIKRGLNINE